MCSKNKKSICGKQNSTHFISNKYINIDYYKSTSLENKVNRKFCKQTSSVKKKKNPKKREFWDEIF